MARISITPRGMKGPCEEPVGHMSAHRMPCLLTDVVPGAKAWIIHLPWHVGFVGEPTLRHHEIGSWPSGTSVNFCKPFGLSRRTEDALLVPLDKNGFPLGIVHCTHHSSN